MDIQYSQHITNQTTIKKVQGIHGTSTFTIVLPKDFVSVLNILKDDYLKVYNFGQSTYHREGNQLNSLEGI